MLENDYIASQQNIFPVALTPDEHIDKNNSMKIFRCSPCNRQISRENLFSRCKLDVENKKMFHILSSSNQRFSYQIE